MKFKNWLKSLDYRHYICVIITLVFVATSVFAFPYAFKRICECFRDFGTSVAYYFCKLFGIGDVHATINDLSEMPIYLPNGFPATWDEFQICWNRYWDIFFKRETISAYWQNVGDVSLSFAYFLMFVPILMVGFYGCKHFLEKPNNDYNVDSKHLRRFKKLSDKTYRPAKAWLVGFVGFVKEHKSYYIIWACIFAYAFNFFAIAIEFVSYYLYFCMAFDFVHLYRQIYKLIVDLSVVFTKIPLWLWLVIGYGVICVLRKKIAYLRLNHFEMKNRGFINERSIVCFIVGTMGKGKTTMEIDMGLSTEAMFRDKAFELLLENDLRFPYFPWINFENALRDAMEKHAVYNLATCKRFVRSKQKNWERNKSQKKIFMYDFERYGLTSCDELCVKDIWQVLESYAQLYFIYIVQSSLIIGNLSTRTDNVIDDIGNFPIWNTDFFKRDARLIDAFSRHSHILDFDMLRLGKRLVEENERSDMFEFGVVTITEIGKERLNALELSDVKKSDKRANQKNDLFNYWLKMARHSATVDGYPFIKVFVDEQRPESWGADARELSEIVHIVARNDKKLAMPFFAIEELIYDFVFSRFVNLYKKYRYLRGDNTLSMYVLKSICTKIHSYYTGIYNRFSYISCDIALEAGVQDGKMALKKYYLATKKIYSKRFSTDCFSEFFTEKTLKSTFGLDDLVEFKTEKASFDEMLQENSYFFEDLCKMLKSDKNKQG